MYEDDDLRLRLVFARGSRGLSQAGLARLAEIAPTQLSRYESGRSKPRPETLHKLASILDVSPRWLATGEGSINDHEFPDEIPEGIKEITVELPDEVIIALRREAAAAGVSVSEQINRVIIAFAEQLNKAKQASDEVDEIAKRVADRLKMHLPPK
ncbi:helix-turn-helix domain-containing protein [Cupriavidus taiwanensis]|uniref:helix-turn-helix domain-containing protein n=1 Tax=Cupriavidus taiwanensis TaxID=164546 RepID=UPI001573C38D|nr:helix-turn-helix transcriptional regulator [Cupriavidus taiwanensis]NSX14973.1 helix-turn-helix domain-containing protein [Cupriavidus taiwanensis]